MAENKSLKKKNFQMTFSTSLQVYLINVVYKEEENNANTCTILSFSLFFFILTLNKKKKERGRESGADHIDVIHTKVVTHTDTQFVYTFSLVRCIIYVFILDIFFKHDLN